MRQVRQKIGGLFDTVVARVLQGAVAPADPPGELTRPDFYTGFLAAALFMAGARIAYDLFSPLIPAGWMMAWAIPTSLFFGFWLAFNVFIAVRDPVEPEVSRIWEPLARLVMIGTACVIISSIWLFLPFASDELRLMMLALYATYVPITIMTTTAKSQIDMLATMGTAVSAALVVLIVRDDHAPVIAGFSLAYGVVMLSLGRHTRRMVRGFLAAKQESAETARGLALALADVAAERDAKARFIISASHDLGQPLQAARLFFDQAMGSKGGASRDNAKRGVHWAFDTSEQLLRQMIDHLRLEAGAITVEMADVAVGPLIAGAAEHLEPAARLAGARIIALPSQLRVCADPALIERALGNIVGNAIRHASARRILIGAKSYGRTARLWVIDDGTGIPPADIPRLFDDYVQGSDHGDQVRGGFGLGLASARRMAELMGGSVGLDRNWINGSAFFLELSVTQGITG
jgi:signal transduction histidine kinase